jgi:DNA-binding transcriptional MerR regulator
MLQAPESARDLDQEHHGIDGERLAFIRHGRALDIPLANVQRLLDFAAYPDADCGDINRLIDEQLARVRALERQFVALRAHCGAKHPARRGIVHELVAAARDEGHAGLS